MPPNGPPLGAGRTLQIATVLFFLSGATGLAYEVIWFKRFSHLWGSSTLAMAAVVASFLCGLGVGARLLGRLADRVTSPLWWYGACELGIGLLGLAIPLALGPVTPLAARLYEPLSGLPVLHWSARFLVTCSVIGPSCLLMGGTLPLLVKQFTPAGTELKRATAWLYGINTLGAAAGCYLTGFHMLPAFGLVATNGATAAINLVIGIVAVWVGSARLAGGFLPGETRPASTASEKARRAHEAPSYPRGAVFRTALMTGTAALVLQVAWNRQLALILGGSTHAFTAMLFVILVGTGLGSLIHHAWLRESRHLLHLPAIVILLTMATTVLGQRAIPHLTRLMGFARPWRSSDIVQGLLGTMTSATMEFLPTLGMGVLFPLLAQLLRRGSDDAGKAVGTLYAWNTFGTIIGATATSLVLIPTFGTAVTVTVALAFYAVAALVLLAPGGLRGTGRRLVVGGLAAAVIADSATLWSVDPRITNWGMFMYGSETPEVIATSETLFFREGSSCNVLVLESHVDGGRSLRVNGKVDASDRSDMRTQTGNAYVPRFLRPLARKVLVIGYGSGTTAGASLQFPGTHVTCTEIEPAVFAASDYFAHVNHRPETSPNFSIVFDDGRSHLQGTDQTYDIIVSEPSNPWIAGVSNLFTREFYEIAKAHLTPDGVLAQWVQTYNLTPESYAMIVRTILSVFPHAGLVRLSERDTILLASRAPLAPTVETVAAAQRLVDASPTVSADLEKWFGTKNVRNILTTLYVLDEAGLARMVEKLESATLNTDANMRLEFDAARGQWAEAPSMRDTVYWNVMASTTPEWFMASFQRIGGPSEEAGVFHHLVLDFSRLGMDEQATRLADLGLQLDPSHAKLLGDKLVLSPPKDPEAVDAALKQILADSEVHASVIAAALHRRGQLDLSADLYERILALHPASPTVLKGAAGVYAAQGRHDLARETLGRALALDPLDQEVSARISQTTSENR